MAINKPNNPVASQQKKGSGFVNLGRILDANEKNKLASAVGEGLKSGASGVQQGLQQTAGQFQSQADAANLASEANKQVRQQALQNIGGGQTDVGDKLVEQFGQFRAGQYAGPQELNTTKVSQLGARAGELQGLGSQLRGGGDKGQVLQAFVGQRPDYSQGQKRLDSLLLGKGPNAQQELGEARRATSGLQQQIGREQDIARQLGELRASQAQQFGKETREQLGLKEGGGFLDTGALGGLRSSLQTAADAANLQRTQGSEAAKALLSKIASGSASFNDNTNAQLLASGLTQQQIDELKNVSSGGFYGTDPTLANYFGFQSVASPTMSSIANQQQRLQAQALARLAGVGETDTGILAQDTQYDTSRPFNVNTGELAKNISSQKQAYQKAEADIKPRIEEYKKAIDLFTKTGGKRPAAWDRSTYGNLEGINSLEDANRLYAEAQKAYTDLRNKYGVKGAPGEYTGGRNSSGIRTLV